MNCHPAFTRSNSKLHSWPRMMLADSESQTEASESQQHNSAAQDAAKLRAELQRHSKDAAAMRRGVAAALQQAQDKAQAQARDLCGNLLACSAAVTQVGPRFLFNFGW